MLPRNHVTEGSRFDRAAASLTAADLLHHIRALVRQVLREANRTIATRQVSVEGNLASLLRHAIDSKSALDIAVVLGCAAELSMFPEESVLEQCTSTVGTAGQRAVRAVVWAVRHRSMRAGPTGRRFIV